MERPGRRRKSKTIGPKPIQLALFPDSVSLCRIRPELNEWRYYRIEVWPDLFGGALLMRQWGRIGTAGRQCFDMHSDAGAAVNALAVIARGQEQTGLPAAPHLLIVQHRQRLIVI
jgi:predicted DNA-binding WGR domain protein